MKIKETVGIDVSKLTLDVTIYNTREHLQCLNNLEGFKELVEWVNARSKFECKNIFYAFEHTGLYSDLLAIYLTKQKIMFALIPGLEIKRSLGITRGKDDKVDSYIIARYAYRLRDEISEYTMPSKDLNTLKKLLSLRDRMVKQNAGNKASLREFKTVLVKKENKTLFAELDKLIKYLKKSIAKIEKEMSEIIKENENLNRLYKLITSIKGIGPQIALNTLIYTNGFTKFDNHRQFASYCGVAPFPNSSGTSIRGKTKVNNLANKKMKYLLDLGAKSALQHNLEIKLFYEKRISQGKNKMSTINIIRNKLIARMFAVVKRDSPYVDLLKYAA